MASKSTTHESKRIYALRRMRLAIERAIRAKNAREKQTAACWAAAWGKLAGIPHVKCQQNA